MTYRKKLIEVALPLDAINAESAREKSIRHGHPSTLHLWWARRPLAACRAVIFASLVDDPSAHPDQFPTEEAQEARRRELFSIIEQLVKWENSTNQIVLDKARAEILKCTNGHPPPLLDPFCGGGSIPLEAQRLGLEAHASDLNPVAVLITKALIEIPPRFSGCPPVNPESRAKIGPGDGRSGARGLAEDVRYYGKWMRDEAQRRIGHFYPKVSLPKEHGGGEATVIAWLWARTVRCPNPACGARMPLVRSFALSTKKGKQAWVEPVVDHAARTVRFTVCTGGGTTPPPPKTSRGANFRCLVCGQSATDQHIKDEGKAGRMGAQMLAMVAEGQRGRIYLPPSNEHEVVAQQAKPEWMPEQEMAYDPRNIWCIPYGLETFADLFTGRQLVALTTFSDLVGEARERARQDGVAAGLTDDGVSLAEGGCGATAYGDAVGVYLALAVDRSADRGSTICSWDSSPKMEALRNTFARQAIPMTWDYAEGNPFSTSSGNWLNNVEWTAMVVDSLQPHSSGSASQYDSTESIERLHKVLVSTDPPYYDNIGYADLSDFFYVWLRRSLARVFPDLFGTMLVPKAQELVATPYRFGGSKEKAQQFFEHGLGRAFAAIQSAAHPDYPVTIYYAFKQAESEGEDEDRAVAVASTGWETMLEGLLRAGFSITGTWPMRSELGNRMLASGTNALASSIVLVCRPRPADAPRTTRREFMAALKRELPEALRNLQHGNIAPVDLAQAAIGPGMAVFSRYSTVMEASGDPMRVRTALQLINQALDEVLSEQEGEFDSDTRWSLAWFEQNGMNEGPYGTAETLSKAKNTSVGGLAEAGILAAKGGKVRLLRREELPADWDPSKDRRLTAWEAAQHLIRALEQQGEDGAAALKARLGETGEKARDLAYRLYSICERKGWAQEALSYNALVIAWPRITELAGRTPAALSEQHSFRDQV